MLFSSRNRKFKSKFRTFYIFDPISHIILISVFCFERVFNVALCGKPLCGP